MSCWKYGSGRRIYGLGADNRIYVQLEAAPLSYAWSAEEVEGNPTRKYEGQQRDRSLEYRHDNFKKEATILCSIPSS